MLQPGAPGWLSGKRKGRHEPIAAPFLLSSPSGVEVIDHDEQKRYCHDIGDGYVRDHRGRFSAPSKSVYS